MTEPRALRPRRSGREAKGETAKGLQNRASVDIRARTPPHGFEMRSRHVGMNLREVLQQIIRNDGEMQEFDRLPRLTNKEEG